jgi:hypothetical protein
MNAQEAPIYVTNNLTGTFQKDPINYHNLHRREILRNSDNIHNKGKTY